MAGKKQKRRLQEPGKNELADKPSEKPSGKENNGEEKRNKGENIAGANRPKSETEKVDGKKVQAAWGDLPDYLKKHGRGSMPDVPAKYRKYLEALNKKGNKANKK